MKPAAPRSRDEIVADSWDGNLTVGVMIVATRAARAGAGGLALGQAAGDCDSALAGADDF